jgi:hypothetical protein
MLIYRALFPDDSFFIQVCVRSPQEEMDFTNLLSIFKFGIQTYIVMMHAEVADFGNTELKRLLEMLSQEDDSTKKFYCMVTFIDSSPIAVLD